METISRAAGSTRVHNVAVRIMYGISDERAYRNESDVERGFMDRADTRLLLSRILLAEYFMDEGSGHYLQHVKSVKQNGAARC